MRRGSASDMKPAIANEINAMRRNIKQIHRGIIHPRTDKWIQYWDAVSFICLLFTACVTPVEGCDISSPATSASPSPAAQQRSWTRGRDDSMDA